MNLGLGEGEGGPSWVYFLGKGRDKGKKVRVLPSNQDRLWTNAQGPGFLPQPSITKETKVVNKERLKQPKQARKSHLKVPTGKDKKNSRLPCWAGMGWGPLYLSVRALA